MIICNDSDSKKKHFVICLLNKKTLLYYKISSCSKKGSVRKKQVFFSPIQTLLLYLIDSVLVNVTGWGKWMHKVTSGSDLRSKCVHTKIFFFFVTFCNGHYTGKE